MNRPGLGDSVGAYGYGLYQDEIDEYLSSDEDVLAIQVRPALAAATFALLHPERRLACCHCAQVTRGVACFAGGGAYPDRP